MIFCSYSPVHPEADQRIVMEYHNNAITYSHHDSFIPSEHGFMVRTNPNIVHSIWVIYMLIVNKFSLPRLPSSIRLE
jgi:hypothetical protein